MEFPKHVHKADGLWKQVENRDEELAALESGWLRRPPSDALKDAIEAQQLASASGPLAEDQVLVAAAAAVAKRRR